MDWMGLTALVVSIVATSGSLIFIIWKMRVVGPKLEINEVMIIHPWDNDSSKIKLKLLLQNYGDRMAYLRVQRLYLRHMLDEEYYRILMNERNEIVHTYSDSIGFQRLVALYNTVNINQRKLFKQHSELLHKAVERGDISEKDKIELNYLKNKLSEELDDLEKIRETIRIHANLNRFLNISDEYKTETTEFIWASHPQSQEEMDFIINIGFSKFQMNDFDLVIEGYYFNHRGKKKNLKTIKNLKEIEIKENSNQIL